MVAFLKSISEFYKIKFSLSDEYEFSYFSIVKTEHDKLNLLQNILYITVNQILNYLLKTFMYEQSTTN